MNETAGARLKRLRDELGLDQKGLALRLGVSPGVIGFAERGERLPSKRLLQRLFEELGVSQDWVLFGAGEMLLPGNTVHGRSSATVEAADRSRPAHGDVKIDGVEFQRIRVWDIEVSAGNGFVFSTENIIDQMAFSRSWLLQHGINGDLAGLVRVKGDSMLPSIPDGSLVLVHRAEMSVESGNIYAFSIDDELFVKRLFRIEEKGERGFLMISDNPGYKPQKLLGMNASRLRIAGRVRTVITEL